MPYVENTLYSTNKYSCVRQVHTLYISYFTEHNRDDEPHDYFTWWHFSTFSCRHCLGVAEITDPDDIYSPVSLQVVDVIGPDHAIEHTESEKDSPFTGERWFDMKKTISGTMPDG